MGSNLNQFNKCLNCLTVSIRVQDVGSHLIVSSFIFIYFDMFLSILMIYISQVVFFLEISNLKCCIHFSPSPRPACDVFIGFSDVYPYHCRSQFWAHSCVAVLSYPVFTLTAKPTNGSPYFCSCSVVSKACQSSPADKCTCGTTVAPNKDRQTKVGDVNIYMTVLIDGFPVAPSHSQLHVEPWNIRVHLRYT